MSIVKHLPEEAIASLSRYKNEEDLENTSEFGRGISISGPDVSFVNGNTQQLINWESCKANIKETGLSNKEFSFKWEEVKPAVNQESEVCKVQSFI